MSVVGPDYEKLKRFNLEELRQPISSTASGAMEDTNKVTEGQKDE
jgi:tRNA acetyltransferase TAN1